MPFTITSMSSGSSGLPIPIRIGAGVHGVDLAHPGGTPWKVTLCQLRTEGMISTESAW